MSSALDFCCQFNYNTSLSSLALFSFLVFKEVLVDQEQLPKVFIEGTELEYLFDDDQWLPATIALNQVGSSHSPNITIQLLRYPLGHSGIIYPDANDVKHRLRLKGSS
jgi:hypothetical protein